MELDRSSNSPTFMFAPSTRQSVSNLGAGAIGGQVNAVTNFNDPFGWGTNTSWGTGGFFQPRGSTHSSGGLRNPVADARNDAATTQSPPWNRNEQVQQGAPWATLWDASKPCSPGRNSSVVGHRPNRNHSSYHLLNDQVFNQVSPSSMWVTNNSFGCGTAQGGNHCSSHRLLNSLTPNQAAKPSVCITRNNFRWDLTQQAAGPGLMPVGASPVNPKASSGAIPKISSKAKPTALSKR
ncbi:hypothetical protein HOLleu_34462 [Holothuria leucospilota]|uniref:Uncharacterized protein n=1 Tax=Holothuria leucospilota TaxID=206669 RepID=A0A9Q1BGP9_HOLLE|nr:hypothetical protein HOLleu_34462 [Holothuria leucospilota]